jgi:hypothetical protein
MRYRTRALHSIVWRMSEPRGLSASTVSGVTSRNTSDSSSARRRSGARSARSSTRSGRERPLSGGGGGGGGGGSGGGGAARVDMRVTCAASTSASTGAAATAAPLSSSRLEQPELRLVPWLDFFSHQRHHGCWCSGHANRQQGAWKRAHTHTHAQRPSPSCHACHATPRPSFCARHAMPSCRACLPPCCCLPPCRASPRHETTSPGGSRPPASLGRLQRANRQELAAARALPCRQCRPRRCRPRRCRPHHRRLRRCRCCRHPRCHCLRRRSRPHRRRRPHRRPHCRRRPRERVPHPGLPRGPHSSRPHRHCPQSTPNPRLGHHQLPGRRARQHRGRQRRRGRELGSSPPRTPTRGTRSARARGLDRARATAPP